MCCRDAPWYVRNFIQLRPNRRVSRIGGRTKVRPYNCVLIIGAVANMLCLRLNPRQGMAYKVSNVSVTPAAVQSAGIGGATLRMSAVTAVACGNRAFMARQMR